MIHVWHPASSWPTETFKKQIIKSAIAFSMSKLRKVQHTTHRPCLLFLEGEEGSSLRFVLLWRRWQCLWSTLDTGLIALGFQRSHPLLHLRIIMGLQQKFTAGWHSAKEENEGSRRWIKSSIQLTWLWTHASSLCNHWRFQLSRLANRGLVLRGMFDQADSWLLSGLCRTTRVQFVRRRKPEGNKIYEQKFA